ncbi:MAG TPA: glycosyltransferase family 4 protein [Povalibacter sp.]|uniref:glycosyltransferase family 4 protein n=1 Tax=Povalibacter sp. TaxID=1962978 RepID=UPI002C1428A7|nr:glycosyltransferase family 4 protein [Povalibacter sp.]HMN45104.1 glycosyltransferase family 4 protein [Povalibacter sp.]
MKVLFVSTLYAPNEKGGAERTVRILAESLVANGHEAVVVSLAPDGQARQGEIGGVRTWYVPLANLFWKQSEAGRSRIERMSWHLIDAYNPVMARRVRRILEQERPDVVQTSNLQGFSVSLWPTIRSMNIPLVQMLHDYYLGCPKCTMVSGDRNCARQCGPCRVYSTPRRLYSNLPAAVISLSRRMLTRLEDTGLFGDVPHKFVIHGANNARVQPTPRVNKAPGTPIVVGYLGRMENTKGIEVLLDAVKRLPESQVTVLLGGRGEESYVDGLRRAYPASNVQFLGFVRPAEFLERIDLLVVPSVWEEPLGRVIYEAYGHGVPSMVANVGGMPEIVDDGRTGFVYRPADSEHLASLLRQQIDAGWRGADFFAACIERAADFSVDRVFADYLKVWETAIRVQSVPPAATGCVAPRTSTAS